MTRKVFTACYAVFVLTLFACAPGAGDRDGLLPDDHEVLEEIVAEFGDADDGGIALRDALADAGLIEVAEWARPTLGQKPPPAPPVGSPAVDDDGDGFTENGGDCDDGNPEVYVGAPEYCDGDGVDNDCDGQQAPGDVNPVDGFVLSLDMDGDGFGDPSTRFQGCGTTYMSPTIVRLTRLSRDCDDTTRSTRPFLATEILDGVDNNCDGVMTGRATGRIDEPQAMGLYPCFRDDDSDMWGATFANGGFVGLYPSGQCPAGSVPQGRDCDDTNRYVNPQRRESCDGIDQDCDGFVDNAQGPGRDTFRNPTTGDIVTIWYGTCNMLDLGYYPW